jgi:histidine ammonia-lyase
MLNKQIKIKNLYNDLDARIASLNKDCGDVIKSRSIVENALKTENAYYGINTGFGILAHERISKNDLEKLQKNLLLSHAVGIGNFIPKEISKLILELKIHSLSQGYSGVSEETFKRLLYFRNKNLISVIPSKGSVGASGDLAPLAHMSLPMIGKGYFWDKDGIEIVPAEVVLKNHNLEPLKLKAKDGLSLINGTQMMSAYGAYVLKNCINLLKITDIIGAMSLEALQGSMRPFDKRIHAIRPHPGQSIVAENLLLLLKDSKILKSHRDCGKVQDPYCLRCIPQVHGACRDSINYASSVIETEINSVTDNPLVFGDDQSGNAQDPDIQGDIISGGNFHGEPLALVLDFAAMALSEFGNISERRTYLLLEGHDGLPKLLMKETGINSGFMMTQYTAAALVSENKILSHPASVDSIPTSSGQEDHVSMGSISAIKLLRVYENLIHILAIELFTVAQALDFRKPLKPGKGVDVAHEFVRSQIPHMESDRYIKGDLTISKNIIKDDKFIECIEKQIGKLN